MDQHVPESSKLRQVMAQLKRYKTTFLEYFKSLSVCCWLSQLFLGNNMVGDIDSRLDLWYCIFPNHSVQHSVHEDDRSFHLYLKSLSHLCKESLIEPLRCRCIIEKLSNNTLFVSDTQAFIPAKNKPASACDIVLEI